MMMMMQLMPWLMMLAGVTDDAENDASVCNDDESSTSSR